MHSLLNLALLFVYLLCGTSLASVELPFGSLQVRTGPGHLFDPFFTLHPGQPFQVLQITQSRPNPNASGYVNRRMVKAIEKNRIIALKENVNIRNAPDTKAPIVMQMRLHQEYETVSRVGEWYCIRPLPLEEEGLWAKIEGASLPYSAWVPLKFLQIDPQKPDSARLKVREANVRRGPGQDFFKIGVLSQNMMLLIHQIENGWARITTEDGLFAPWIRADLLGLKSSGPLDSQTSAAQSTVERVSFELFATQSDQHPYPLPAFQINLLESLNPLNRSIRPPEKKKPLPKKMRENHLLFCKFPKGFHWGRELRTSKWGPVGLIQKSLGMDRVDGVLDAETSEEILQAQKSMHLPQTGCIDSLLWTNLLPDSPLPDYKARARSLTFLMEGTDYDRIEFNFGTRDKSGVTWGPSGMTLLSGEIQAILKRAIQHNEKEVRQVADSGFEIVKKLSGMPPAPALKYVRETFFEPGSGRQNVFKGLFRRLAQSKTVRDAFDYVEFATVKERMDPYEDYLKHFKHITEVDWAMFWDIAVQTGGSRQKVKAMGRMVHPKMKLPLRERRQIWGEITAGKREQVPWKPNRLKRNEVYYQMNHITKAYNLREISARF